MVRPTEFGKPHKLQGGQLARFGRPLALAKYFSRTFNLQPAASALLPAHDLYNKSIGFITASSCFALLAAVLAAPVWAHHSAAAEYDASKLLVLTGTVTKLEWTNPHTHLRLMVKDPQGAAVGWYLEMAAPSGMRRQGWFPGTLQPGNRVTVEAYPAKDLPSVAKVHRVKIPDGRWLWVDSTGPNEPSE